VRLLLLERRRNGRGCGRARVELWRRSGVRYGQGRGAVRAGCAQRRGKGGWVGFGALGAVRGEVCRARRSAAWTGRHGAGVMARSRVFRRQHSGGQASYAAADAPCLDSLARRRDCRGGGTTIRGWICKGGSSEMNFTRVDARRCRDGVKCESCTGYAQR